MSATEKRKIKVFIASPNDLAEERRKFRDAIKVLNIGFGDGANVEFVDLGWEDTLASTGRRNQGVINQKIDSCDVFILAMNRRWGQDAPDAAPYSSYTEEEFHRALERLKKSGAPEIFVFFKRVDAATEADAGPQLSMVIKFRQHLEETRQVFYRYFDSSESFLEEVDKHLRAYAKGELPKAELRDDTVVLPIVALQEVEKAKKIVLQKTEEAKQANDVAEKVRLQLEAAQLQMADISIETTVALGNIGNMHQTKGCLERTEDIWKQLLPIDEDPYRKAIYPSNKSGGEMSEKQSFSVADVAQFMFEESQKFDFLDQDMTASQIKDKFGPEFVSETEAAGMSIRPEVRKVFRALITTSGQKVEWSSGDKCWYISPQKKLGKGKSPSSEVDAKP